MFNWILKHLFYPNSYAIKSDYRPNFLTRTYHDTPEYSRAYQTPVYQLAQRYLKKHQGKRVLDVGCGYGFKLAEFIAPVATQIVGIDTESAITYCRNHYSFGSWLVDNLERPSFPIKGSFDLIISADVIEHLRDPDMLLTYLRHYAKPDSTLILSTPERDLVRGKSHLGPPDNPAHVREWNKSELANYLKSKGVTILQHELVADRRAFPGEKLKNKSATCQVVIGRVSKS